MGSLCISLTSPATLEHLTFKFSFGYSLFQSSFSAFCGGLRGADGWRHLDSITTHPTGSRLQRVDIKIYYSFLPNIHGDEPDGNDVLEAVLDSLPLLRTKGILFVEAIA
jgi:hypothetical protein